MQDLQFYDWMRIATAIFAALAAYRLSHRVRAGHKSYSTRLKEWVWIIFAILFVQALGAIENVLQDTDYRVGSMLSFFISLAAFRAARKGGPLQRIPQDRSR